MTVFQGIFQSEGTRDGRGPQHTEAPAGHAARSHHTCPKRYPEATTHALNYTPKATTRAPICLLIRNLPITVTNNTTYRQGTQLDTPQPDEGTISESSLVLSGESCILAAFCEGAATAAKVPAWQGPSKQ
ncbi:MAG: hypothetical protein R3F50_08415 [Gammaproteobacteria bacterium]|jgi:hypothetical protein